jgi:hypothetical protein
MEALRAAFGTSNCIVGRSRQQVQIWKLPMKRVGNNTKLMIDQPRYEFTERGTHPLKKRSILAFLDNERRKDVLSEASNNLIPNVKPPVRSAL